MMTAMTHDDQRSCRHALVRLIKVSILWSPWRVAHNQDIINSFALIYLGSYRLNNNEGSETCFGCYSFGCDPRSAHYVLWSKALFGARQCALLWTNADRIHVFRFLLSIDRHPANGWLPCRGRSQGKLFVDSQMRRLWYSYRIRDQMQSWVFHQYGRCLPRLGVRCSRHPRRRRNARNWCHRRLVHALAFPSFCSQLCSQRIANCNPHV